MAATLFLYTHGISAAYGSESAGGAPAIDWLSDTIKVALCTSSYTPNQDAHDFFDDITNEVTGTGYSAGGATLGTKTLANSENVVTFDAADTSWTSSTITARYGIIYKDTGVAATSPLIAYVDFGQNYTSTNGTFQITWHNSGIFSITAENAA